MRAYRYLHRPRLRPSRLPPAGGGPAALDRARGEGDPPAPPPFDVAAARVAHLATSDQYARPHVVPIVFVYRHPYLYTPVDRKKKRDEDWRQLRRVRNVVTNGRASVVVDVWSEDWSKLAYTLLEGTAEVLESGAERDGAIALLEAKYGQYGDLPLGDAPVIRVTVERRIEWEASEGAD